MRMGIQTAWFNPAGGAARIGPALLEFALRAEAKDFYSLWTMDHFFGIPLFGEAEANVPEAYTVLGFLAAHTTRVKLGALVNGVNYRYPGILIKQVSTLDVLSGGRAYFGIGAGWFEREYRGLGAPFPSLATRFAQLEETLLIAKQMWSANNGPFAGEHYQLAETIDLPAPLTRPHPPIMIGGGGEKKTLRLVAQYADATNLGIRDMGNVAHKLDVLREHCAAVGRPFSAIELTTHGGGVMTPEMMRAFPQQARDAISPAEMVDRLSALAELGVTHHIFAGAVEIPEMIDLIAEEIAPRIPPSKVITA